MLSFKNGDFPLIFHSYVNLPEGNPHQSDDPRFTVTPNVSVGCN